MARQINQAGLDLIKSFEKYEPVGYLPTPNDRPTAGWGHTGTDVEIGVEYPQDQCEEWLRDDLIGAESAVSSAVSTPLTDNEFAACVSLAFNIGGGAFQGSTLCRLLNAQSYDAAADQFPRWNKQAGQVLGGLTRRRAAERELFLTPAV